MVHVITSLSLWISKEDQLVSLDCQDYKFPPSQSVFLCAMYPLLSLELRVIIIPGHLRLSNREKCLLMHMSIFCRLYFLPKYYTSNKCASLRLAIGFWIQGSELFLDGLGGRCRCGKFTFENLWELEYIFYLFFSCLNYSEYGPYITVYTYG